MLTHCRCPEYGLETSDITSLEVQNPTLCGETDIHKFLECMKSKYGNTTKKVAQQ